MLQNVFQENLLRSSHLELQDWFTFTVVNIANCIITVEQTNQYDAKIFLNKVERNHAKPTVAEKILPCLLENAIDKSKVNYQILTYLPYIIHHHFFANSSKVLYKRNNILVYSFVQTHRKFVQFCGSLVWCFHKTKQVYSIYHANFQETY